MIIFYFTQALCLCWFFARLLTLEYTHAHVVHAHVVHARALAGLYVQEALHYLRLRLQHLRTSYSGVSPARLECITGLKPALSPPPAPHQLHVCWALAQPHQLHLCCAPATSMQLHSATSAPLHSLPPATFVFPRSHTCPFLFPPWPADALTRCGKPLAAWGEQNQTSSVRIGNRHAAHLGA